MTRGSGKYVMVMSLIAMTVLALMALLAMTRISILRMKGLLGNGSTSDGEHQTFDFGTPLLFGDSSSTPFQSTDSRIIERNLFGVKDTSICFLKTHKTASTTIGSIFYRVATLQRLRFV